MGLFDSLKSALGIHAETDAAREADPDDLFGMSTAYMTMEADLGFEPLDVAALCFSDVDSTSFTDALDEVEAILEAGEEETGTSFRRREDAHGYQWVIFEDPDPEDLVTSIHFAADTFVEKGFGSRLLAAVFAFEQADGRRERGANAIDAASATRAYWIYSFRRGGYYPFVPAGERERDQRIEFKLESVLNGELDIEEDESYWYPLWPDNPGGHPWE